MSEVQASRSLTRLGLAGQDSSFAALPRGRWWLNVLLFLLTFLTTTAFGYALTQSFATGQPLDLNGVLDGYVKLSRLDANFFRGAMFSVPLLLILLAHEFGHYAACSYWKVDASVPYFLPSPTLLGTLGAFIRIRSPIYTRAILFDIGVAGPVAGFVVLTPFLIAGIRMSELVRTKGPDAVVFGTPLLMNILERLRFGNQAPESIALHPFAVAGWAGLLATAVNLMPMGQLDGGHILYAALGQRWHRIISTSCIVLMGALGFFYWAWWGWAVVMFFFGRRHPLVFDEMPLSSFRRGLTLSALLLLILSVSIVPVLSR